MDGNGRSPASSLLDPGLWALVAAAIIWGSTFVVTKIALEEAGPFMILFLRFLIAVAVIAPFAWKRGFRWKMAVKLRFLGLGFLGIFLPFGLHNVGLVYTTAANTALIFAALPGWMAVFGFIILGERMTSRKIVAVVLSIAGVVVITGASVSRFGFETLTGDLLMVGSTLTWSLYTVYSRRTVVGMDPLVATVATMGAGLLFIIPPTIGEVVLIGLPSLSLVGAGAIFFLGACGAGLALALWNIGLRRIEASVAAPLANLEAVVGVALAAAIGETISGGQLLGGAVVLTGAVIGSLAGSSGSEIAPGRRGTVPATTRRAGETSPGD